MSFLKYKNLFNEYVGFETTLVNLELFIFFIRSAYDPAVCFLLIPITLL